MGLLTRDQILNADDLPRETVEVPEWGGSVLVRGMTGRQRDRFEESMVQEKKGKRKLNMQDFRARGCAECIIDEKGERVFSEQDVQLLAQKSAAALERVYAVVARLSGLRPEDEEELLGNSGNGESGDSGSD